MNGDLSFLQAILDALEERVRGCDPTAAMNEMGVFVEWFHDRLRETLGLPSEDIQALHVDLAKIGIVIGAGGLSGLVSAAARRNVADHAGTGREFLNSRQRDGTLLNLRGDVDLVVLLLDRHGLLANVLAAIERSPPELPRWLEAAESLATILESEPVEDLVPIALDEAPILRHVDVRSIPERIRLRVILRKIGGGARWDSGLGMFARRAQDVVSEIARQQVARWLERLEIRAKPTTPHRLTVLRIDLDAADRPGAVILRRARMVSPDMALDGACSRTLPREVQGMKALGRALRTLFVEIARELVTRGDCQVPGPNVVLLLTVPADHWSMSVEDLVDDVGARIHALFHCLVVRPPGTAGGTLRSGWVEYPEADASTSRSYLLAEYQRPERVVELMSSRDCLFLSRDAYTDPRRPQILPTAFRYYPCAIINRDGNMNGLLDALFPERRVPLGNLFKSVTNYRKAGGRVTVLWDDLAYQPEELIDLEELDALE